MTDNLIEMNVPATDRECCFSYVFKRLGIGSPYTIRIIEDNPNNFTNEFFKDSFTYVGTRYEEGNPIPEEADVLVVVNTHKNDSVRGFPEEIVHLALLNEDGTIDERQGVGMPVREGIPIKNIMEDEAYKNCEIRFARVLDK